MSFETWGFTDKHSSQPAPQNPMPFDKNMERKPAYFALLETLEKFPRDSPVALAKLRDANGEPKDE